MKRIVKVFFYYFNHKIPHTKNIYIKICSKLFDNLDNFCFILKNKKIQKVRLCLEIIFQSDFTQAANFQYFFLK